MMMIMLMSIIFMVITVNDFYDGDNTDITDDDHLDDHDCDSVVWKVTLLMYLMMIRLIVMKMMIRFIILIMTILKMTFIV